MHPFHLKLTCPSIFEQMRLNVKKHPVWCISKVENRFSIHTENWVFRFSHEMNMCGIKLTYLESWKIVFETIQYACNESLCQLISTMLWIKKAVMGNEFDLMHLIFVLVCYITQYKISASVIKKYSDIYRKSSSLCIQTVFNIQNVHHKRWAKESKCTQVRAVINPPSDNHPKSINW